MSLANGWAADAIRAALPELKKKSISFHHLEKVAGIGHMQPYYRFASHSVHPTSKGLSYTVGLLRQGEILLSGPSNYGLAEPAAATCGSLQLATVALLMLRPTKKRIASLMALATMDEMTKKAFWRAEERIEREEASAQSQRPVR